MALVPVYTYQKRLVLASRFMIYRMQIDRAITYFEIPFLGPPSSVLFFALESRNRLRLVASIRDPSE